MILSCMRALLLLRSSFTSVKTIFLAKKNKSITTWCFKHSLVILSVLLRQFPSISLRLCAAFDWLVELFFELVSVRSCGFSAGFRA